MEANVFIAKLKAAGSKNDWTDLDAVLKDYKEILTNLPTKSRGPFSLNVLCTLCRNLEKVPTWKDGIDNKSLATLSIDCVRETRTLNATEMVKVLACVYHIHRHLVKQDTQIPPELIIKLSYMPFETDTLLTEYCKTYWNIIVDRITYIERLKSKRMHVLKLLQKLSEDIVKVIQIYNTVQFCATIIAFLVKKLHVLYSDLDPKELNRTFGRIFEEIQAKSDLRSFKKLPDKEIFDIYAKLSECLYVVAQNSSKINFEGTVLNTTVQACITIFGHRADLLHCLQTIYLNGFCPMLTENQNLTYIETILTNFVTSCETAEKLGYVKAMRSTYPYIGQFLRLYIEYNVTTNQNNWLKLPDQFQMATLNIMQYLLEMLKTCEQAGKCENCTVKSGLHDALRLSFLIKNILSTRLQANLSVTKMMPLFHSIIMQQYQLLQDLCGLGCANYEKCYRKLQSDVHNTAILLSKSQDYDYSIKLFEVYMKKEMIHFKNENDLKSISRALYNKSICELDFKQYESAILDAYLSLIFAYPDGLKTDKYMSLVMDVKAKSSKAKEDLHDQSTTDDLQMMTVLDACCIAIDEKKYGNIKPFVCCMKFSELLRHEFDMYVKLWPSILPIAGVWKMLYDLTRHDVPWLNAKDPYIQQTIYEVILQTPTAVRTIHNETYSEIVSELLQKWHEDSPDSVEEKIVCATLMFLKAEFNLAEATEKFGWKVAEASPDSDQFPNTRSISQEHEAILPALKAVALLRDILKDDTARVTTNLQYLLHTAQVFVPQLLHLYKILEGLQLAHCCCEIAARVGDKASYIKNASAIIYHANKQTEELTNIITIASKYCAELLNHPESMGDALVFLCDCAIYYKKIKQIGLSAKLVQVVQAKILEQSQLSVNTDLALGKLIEAEIDLCVNEGPSLLTAVFGMLRHYLPIENGAPKWHNRRHRSLTLKLSITRAGIASTTVSRQLAMWRRARSAAVVAMSAAAGVAQGALIAEVVNTHSMDDAQGKINRLKYSLGIPLIPDLPVASGLETKSRELFTPKQDLETMLENMTFRKTQTSPSVTCEEMPGFRMPEFLKHDERCECGVCDNFYCVILACHLAFLEASMYFRAKEFDIAKNYFEGSQICLQVADRRLKSLRTKNCEDYLVDSVKKIFKDHLDKLRIESTIENAFFELSQGNHKMADAFVVSIHETLQENDNISPYIKNEILNLMTASANLRKSTNRTTAEFNLDAEFENLRLSPEKQCEAPLKTPDVKPEKPPKLSRVKVKDDELPQLKRLSDLCVKLNFDDAKSKEKEVKTKKSTKKPDFKMPELVVPKPVLEGITPTPKSRRIPAIIVTQPSVDESSTSVFEFATPKPRNCDKTAFFTPAETPGEQFFTPQTSIKTYTKKSLRHGIVKNLESEFSTPTSNCKTAKVENKSKNLNKENDKSNVKPSKSNSTDSSYYKMSVEEETKNLTKDNVKSNLGASRSRDVETGSVKSLKDKRTLKRATSPGKLEKIDKKPTNTARASRLRKPVKFSLDEDDK